MPKHVHLIAVPSDKDGLRRAIGEAHRRYTRHVNFREGWRGCLWQGRFASFVMDDDYLLTATRYIERKSVRAKIVRKRWRYRYSGARAARGRLCRSAALRLVARGNDPRLGEVPFRSDGRKGAAVAWSSGLGVGLGDRCYFLFLAAARPRGGVANCCSWRRKRVIALFRGVFGPDTTDS